jgi:hypothetical protein
MFTQSQLKKIVNYDPLTGLFTPLQKRTNCKPVLGSKTVRRKTTYLQISISSKHYYAHRLAWFYIYGEWPKLLDHINGDGCDNRIANLRKATPSQSQANVKLYRNSTTGFKGICKTNYRTFRARIMKDKKQVYLGCFKTLGEAHEAYMAAARKLFGDFANAGLQRR